MFWTRTRENRGYNSTFILDAKPGSLRLIHPTLNAWSIRIGALLLSLVLLPLVLYLAKSSLVVASFPIGLAVFFYASGKPSLAFLADHPEKVEDHARVLKFRRIGKWAAPEILVEAWGSETWISVVANEAKLRAALTMAGQPEPEIEASVSPAI